MPGNKPSIYITTTLPYVNADPHVGFALELVQADVFARFQAALGKDVFFNTGTDEHGVKIYRKAVEAGKSAQEYVDEYAEKFRSLQAALGIRSDINFIRTTDAAHVEAAQEFWRRCDKNGFIYKKNYKIKYCVGCELEKTESELVNGRCALHPNQELEVLDEENYFFKFSAFQQKLLELYAAQPDFVIPPTRLHEIHAFVSRGLEDFSISRLASKMPWGVPVPGDSEHVMYVWFDALVSYISAIGWPKDMAKFEKWWPVVQFAGKDNLRQQSAMWQAMLMAAGLPPSQQIVIHGFINSNGQKMSKSLGNVVNPYDLVAEYGTDALRHYLLREAHPFEDSDFTLEKFKEAYNANLANGLGNLASRVLKMAISYGVEVEVARSAPLAFFEKYPAIAAALEQRAFNRGMDAIWQEIAKLDAFIQETQPFKKIKIDEAGAKSDVAQLVRGLWEIALMLEIFLPQTAAKLQALIQEKKMPDAPLFPRKD